MDEVAKKWAALMSPYSQNSRSTNRSSNPYSVRDIAVRSLA